ncbi:hypothetical protein BHE74_00030063 [Ensete ventricosum]|nr:hypothetical protein BHE74_00030063 [Ensete ventricosum]RZS04301.1 hypothetical protein BHM03_00034614 [Ensete ventricosum]
MGKTDQTGKNQPPPMDRFLPFVFSTFGLLLLLHSPAVWGSVNSIYSEPSLQGMWSGRHLNDGVNDLSLGANCSILLHLRHSRNPETIYSGVPDTSSQSCVLWVDSMGTINVWPAGYPSNVGNVRSMPTAMGRYSLAVANGFANIYGPAMFSLTGGVTPTERGKLHGTETVNGGDAVGLRTYAHNGNMNMNILQYGEHRLVLQNKCNLKIVGGNNEVMWETQTEMPSGAICMAELRKDGKLYLGYVVNNIKHRLFGSGYFSTQKKYIMALRHDGDLVIYPMKPWAGSSSAANIRMVVNSIKG